MSAFACARAAARESAGWRYALDTLSLLTLAYVTGLVLDGVPLVLAWAAEAVALARIAERTHDRVAALGSLGFLGLAAGHVLVVEAPPSALVYGVDGLLGVALALGALAVAFVSCARVPLPWDVRGAGHVVASAAILYLSSVAIVGFFQPGVEAVGGVLGLDVPQQGQAILSAFWSLGGVVALWVGLRRGHRTVRLAGLGLLALAVAKVFLYDLVMLESAYRVLSFVVLGVLLLLAAFVFQRIPRAATRPPQPRPGARHQDTSDVDLSGV